MLSCRATGTEDNAWLAALLAVLLDVLPEVLPVVLPEVLPAAFAAAPVDAFAESVVSSTDRVVPSRP
jgi:hypothetical protein